MSSTLPTKQDFYNAKEDLMTVDAVSNSKDPVSGASISNYQTRRGGQTDTLQGRLDKLGLVVAGDTATGCVLNNTNEVVLNNTSGSADFGGWYSWGGVFPKTVVPNTDPALAGSGYTVRTSVATGTQAREALRRSYADAGHTLVTGSFEAGGTLNTAADVLLYTTNGHAYSWGGSFPKVVPPLSSPTSGWVDKSSDLVSTNLSSSSGSSMVGYRGATVENELDSYADKSVGVGVFSAASMVNRRENSQTWGNGKKGVVILGDSISHGAFAGDLFYNGWTRLLARAVNNQLGSGSYGFTPMLTLGYGGPYQSVDIHSLNFTNAGFGWAARDANFGSDYLNGFAFRSTDTGNKIGIVIPSFQRRVLVHHANTSVSGGTFTIKVNGVLKATVNTAQDSNKFAVTEVAMDDNGYGTAYIELETTSVGVVDICGFSYLASVQEPCVQNFSQSGRRAANLSNSVVAEVFSKASTVVFALGHNDAGETGSGYISSVTQVVNLAISTAVANGTKVVVPDFCWSMPATNWMRMLLVRLAKETGGVYVDFPSMLAYPGGAPADTNRLVSVLDMFVDGSHPNASGNAFVFEKVSAAMGLSIQSKKSALDMCDYWVPVSLKPGSGIKNKLTTFASAVRRMPGGLIYRVYLTSESGGAIPQGTYNVSDAFPARTGISLSQVYTSPLMKADASAVMGGVNISVAGSTSIMIGSGGSTYSDIYTTFTMS